MTHSVERNGSELDAVAETGWSMFNTSWSGLIPEDKEWDNARYAFRKAADFVYHQGQSKGYGRGAVETFTANLPSQQIFDEAAVKAKKEAQAALAKTLQRYRLTLMGAAVFGFGGFLGLVLSGVAGSPVVASAQLFTGMLFLGAAAAMGSWLFRNKVTRHGDEP